MNSAIPTFQNETCEQSNRRILFLTTVDFSIHAGGVVYSRSIRDALTSICKVKTVVLSELQRDSSRLFRWRQALFKSLLTGIPPNVLFHSGNLTVAGVKLIAQDWDLIVIDHLESAYACRSSDSPVIYVSHNRESELVSQKIPRAPSWIKKILKVWIDRYEKNTVKSANAVITISSDEAHWYKLYNPLVTVLLPTFDSSIAPFTPGENGRLRVGFLGGNKWKPNCDALDLLLLNILPLVQRRLELVIAGDGWSTQLLEAHLQRSIKSNSVSLRYLGYIDDINEFWTAVDVFAAPIKNGAGVNVKVCEALSNARPVIAFPHALRGLKDISKNLVHIVSNPIEFAQALESIDPTRMSDSPPQEFTSAYAKSKLSNLVATIFSRN